MTSSNVFKSILTTTLFLATLQFHASVTIAHPIETPSGGGGSMSSSMPMPIMPLPVSGGTQMGSMGSSADMGIPGNAGSPMGMGMPMPMSMPMGSSDYPGPGGPMMDMGAPATPFPGSINDATTGGLQPSMPPPSMPPPLAAGAAVVPGKGPLKPYPDMSMAGKPDLSKLDGNKNAMPGSVGTGKPM